MWTYDNAGNILTRKEYSYTTGTPGTPLDTVTYTYGNDQWGDLLTAYDGNGLQYDAIGNLTSDGAWTYTWEHGRQLASMTGNGTTWSYTYDADGMRTGRTNNSTTYSYIYNGGQLTQMTVGSNTLLFTYDASGSPQTVIHNGTPYYYVTNLQGDVTAILDSSGDEEVAYTYDAWGNILDTSGDLASTLGALNPLRYRGYVYDQETGLYYLQSRYYNPEIGRFLNADALVSTGQGLLGNNMFAYCGNNPAIQIDHTGTYWQTIFADETKDQKAAGKTFSAAGGMVLGLVGLGLLTNKTLTDIEILIARKQAQRAFFEYANNGSAAAQVSDAISDGLGQIASTFTNLECVEAVKSMIAYLKKHGINAEMITITYLGGRGFIWSDIRQKAISENGFHCGLLYNGIVFCNVHPTGLPEAIWINDFHSTGQRIIAKAPIL